MVGGEVLRIYQCVIFDQSRYGVIQEFRLYYHYSILWAIDWLEEGGLFWCLVLAWF